MATKCVRTCQKRDEECLDIREGKDNRLCLEETIKNTEFKKNDYAYRTFGYSHVSWVIKNYCIALDKNRFCSPEFYVGSLHLTKWMIVFERNYDPDGETSRVLFHLRRLPCEQYVGEAKVYCLYEYSHVGESLVEEDFHLLYEQFETDHISHQLRNANFHTSDNKHPGIFKFNMHILVSFPGIQETFSPCQNPVIRELSENLGNLYDRINVPNSDLEDIGTRASVIFRLESYEMLQIHRAILFSRIRNEKFRKTVQKLYVNDIDYQEIGLKTADKVFKFLYTGNLQHVFASEPDIKVLNFAEALDVKEIVDYYNPDEIGFTSIIDLEEFHATWTIEDFCSRNDLLESPVMVNKTRDIKWRIQIYPQGRGSDYLDIVLKYEVTVTKYICVEFSLESGSESDISYKCDRKISVDGSMHAHFIKLDHVRDNFMGDDSFTLRLLLRISNGEETISVDQSKTGCKNLPEQKNYERLSDDMLAVYQNDWLKDLPLNLEDLKIKIHKFISYARCNNLRTRIEDDDLDYLNNINPVVINELFIFMYSGKIQEDIPLEIMFCLCDVAIYLDFQNLALVIIGKLKDVVSPSNEKKIRDYVNALNVNYLKGPIQNLLEKII